MWTTSADGDFIVRSFVAKNFVSAMAFLNAVAEVAEEQGHHPDLHLTQFRNVEVRLQTHSLGGEQRRALLPQRMVGDRKLLGGCSLLSKLRILEYVYFGRHGSVYLLLYSSVMPHQAIHWVRLSNKCVLERHTYVGRARLAIPALSDS